MPIRTWWAPWGAVSPLRLCAEQKYSNSIPQQLLLVSVIKALPSLTLQKMQGSTSRYSQMCLQKAKELFRSQYGSTKAMAGHPSSLRPESHKDSRVLGEAQIQPASPGEALGASRRQTQQRVDKVRGYFRISYLLGKLRVHLAWYRTSCSNSHSNLQTFLLFHGT